MIIVTRKGIKPEELEELVKLIESQDLTAKINPGETKTVVNVIGNTAEKSIEPYERLPYVEHVYRIQDRKYHGVTKDFPDEKIVVQVDGIRIGSDKLTLMPGPCAIEGNEQLTDSVKLIKDLKVNNMGENIEGVIMRGGVYKPRTSPDTFQGLKKEGLIRFSQIAHSYGLPIVTEVLDPRDVELVAQYADILQIGARTSQAFSLLIEVGKSKKPVLLKRAMGGSIEELLHSAEYILKEGNENLILCLRGIKGMQDNVYRNAIDAPDIVYLKDKVRVPIIFDPSHSTGERNYVIPISNLAVVAGADGLLVDVHPYPEVALVDAKQQLTPAMAIQFMQQVNHFKGAYRAAKTLNCMEKR